ncbi:MAG: hypothetical protein MK105_05355 [Crocinitomicaceae bacterium]|nr:hypothetical protein [Crocinitomicaceae bacterium]
MEINIDELLDEGQDYFIDLIKRMLYNEDENIFDRIDFENDNIFTEPLLFSYFNSEKKLISLDQILFGYSNKSRRKFSVSSNDRGVIFLPKHAYLFTNLCSDVLDFEYTEEDQIVLTKDGHQVDFRLEEIRYSSVCETIEITDSIDSFASLYFYHWAGRDEQEMRKFVAASEVDLSTYAPMIDEALGLLKRVFPKEYARYVRTMRRIVLFSNNRLRNFATRSAQGTIFLNVNEYSNTTFFLEEIIHQASHCVFNMATYNTQSYFVVDPDDTVAQYSNDKTDHRGLYGALHGIYTTGQIVDLFIQLLESDSNLNFDREMRYELMGRLAVNKNRHNIGLEAISWETIFTSKGNSLFQYYYLKLDQNIENNPKHFKYDVEDHPIVFSYWKFEHDNPIDQYFSNK